MVWNPDQNQPKLNKQVKINQSKPNWKLHTRIQTEPNYNNFAPNPIQTISQLQEPLPEPRQAAAAPWRELRWRQRVALARVTTGSAESDMWPAERTEGRAASSAGGGSPWP